VQEEVGCCLQKDHLPCRSGTVQGTQPGQCCKRNLERTDIWDVIWSESRRQYWIRTQGLKKQLYLRRERTFERIFRKTIILEITKPIV
jgi:hypothetical protein